MLLIVAGELIQEAEIEAELKNKKQALTSLFAQRICQYLDQVDLK